MLRIRKDDMVVVVAGKDKGKKGKVLKVIPSTSRAIVENINVAKKAKRRTQEDQQGGFADVEVPIHVSNLMLLDKKTGQPTRFGVSALKDGTKVRISKKSTEAL